MDRLTAVYPATEWTLSTTADRLRVLTPACLEPSVTVPVPGPGTLLILVRIYAAVDAQPFRIAIYSADRELAGFDAYAAESVLLSPIVQCASGVAQLRLTLRTQWLDADMAAVAATMVYTVSLVAAFAL